MTNAELIENITVWINAKCDDRSKVFNIREIIALYNSSGGHVKPAPNHPEPEDFDDECSDCHHGSHGCHENKCGVPVFDSGFDYDTHIKKINKFTEFINGRR
jgi:hypothetical protein